MSTYHREIGDMMIYFSAFCGATESCLLLLFTRSLLAVQGDRKVAFSCLHLLL